MLVNGVVIGYTQGELIINSPPNGASNTTRRLIKVHVRGETMTDGNNTNPPAIRQLSIFDDRPLPLLIAEKWGFVLRAIEDDTQFCAHDWLTGLTQAKQSAVSLTIRQLRDKGVISNNGVRVDGLDYVNAKTLYDITQNLRELKSRHALAEIKDYLSKAGVFADEVRRNPATAIHAGIEGYRKRGKSEKFIDQRVKGIQSRNDMTDVMKAKITDVIDYARVTRIEYRGLFKRTLGELLSQMKARSFRDNTTHHALYYLNLLEETYTVAMTRIDEASLDEACSIMAELADQIGQQVEATSKLLGIDIATGRPLLQARTR